MGTASHERIAALYRTHPADPKAFVRYDIEQARRTLTREAVASYYEHHWIDVPRWGLGAGPLRQRARSRVAGRVRVHLPPLRQRAAGGEDFAQLATQYSEDPGSATSGTSYDVTAVGDPQQAIYGWNGADAGTAGRQAFPVDAESIALFQREGLVASVTNTWAMEIVPGQRFVYELSRPNGRLFRVEFDLTHPVPAPPAPWGAEG